MPSKRDLARSYRDKYGKQMPTKTLARIMYKENPLLFRDEETARTTLRIIEGKSGQRNKKVCSKKEYFIEEARPYNPYVLPEPESEDLKPFILPKAFNHFIVAGDFHIPNHRLEPINAMLQYAEQNKIRKLVLNGDLLDNTPFSKWMHEPIDKTDVKKWFDMAENFLRSLKKRFDEIYWLEGNHDFWFKRWLMSQAPVLYGDSYFHLEERLHLNDIGIKFIDQRYLVKAGKLNIHHGHILLRGGGTYANGARMLYMKAKASMICSHLHVESSHTEPDLDDKIATTFITGCLCTLRPEYMPFGGKACHGFAEVKIANNGDFSVNNMRIYKGKIL